MVIEIPKMKKRLFRNPVDQITCIKNSIKIMENKRALLSVNLSKYDYKIVGDYYHPYWVGRVRTSTERGFYKQPKVIYYEVVCNARKKEDFIVLRSIPPMMAIDCEGIEVLDHDLKEAEFMHIVENAKEERIDKQFMFGKPDKETQEVRMVYIPVIKLKIRKKNNAKFSEFYVNRITGQIM